MVFNATFNNISVISWWSVFILIFIYLFFIYLFFLVEETETAGENHLVSVNFSYFVFYVMYMLYVYFKPDDLNDI
jgi:uncharacterized membrane protein YdjX (TVP38/TMEM64 family)